MLADLVEREPEARSNPSVQAAYVALDNMEAEELEAISSESALLWKEQQNLVGEMAKAKRLCFWPACMGRSTRRRAATSSSTARARANSSAPRYSQSAKAAAIHR